MDFDIKEKAEQFFLPAAEKLKLLFPNLERDLIQAQMDDDPVPFLSNALFKAISTSSMLAFALFFIGSYTGNSQVATIGALLWPIFFGFLFFTNAKLPEIRSKKRVRKLEKELPYALRHVLIEVRAGIPLYQAMVSVSEGYGEASKEFKHIVKEVNGGVPQIKALENAIVRNPSMQFRRSLWQMINALKSGADVATSLEALVDSITQQQVLAVRKYGKELNPYTMMYMLIAVILPSLGVTFLMILSSFTDISVSDFMFYGILIGLTFFQLIFLNFVKTKRPEVTA